MELDGFWNNTGWLPFTWVNQSVYGLGKWKGKFWIGTFVHFTPDSCFPLAQISSIYRKMAANPMKLMLKMAL